MDADNTTPTTHAPDEDWLIAQTSLNDLVHAVNRLAKVLPAALDAQWQASIAPASADIIGRRGTGGIADPTPSIALDPRRLAVRDAVKGAKVTLARVDRILAQATRNLSTATNAWKRA